MTWRAHTMRWLLIVTLLAAATALLQRARPGGRSGKVLLMGTSPKPSGLSNTRDGKAVILNRTKALVARSEMILVAPVQGVSKENIDLLRKDLPEGTIASVVKNSLLGLSVTGTAFESIRPTLKEENVYFFIPEGRSKSTFEVYQKWRKDANRMEPEYDLKSIVLDGGTFTGAKIQEIANLPTRKELMTSFARSIKNVPMRLTRALNVMPVKVAKALKAIKDKKMQSEAVVTLSEEVVPPLVAEAVAV